MLKFNVWVFDFQRGWLRWKDELLSVQAAGTRKNLQIGSKLEADTNYPRVWQSVRMFAELKVAGGRKWEEEFQSELSDTSKKCENTKRENAYWVWLLIEKMITSKKIKRKWLLKYCLVTELLLPSYCLYLKSLRKYCRWWLLPDLIKKSSTDLESSWVDHLHTGENILLWEGELLRNNGLWYARCRNIETALASCGSAATHG